jgi:hypothetical protein
MVRFGGKYPGRGKSITRLTIKAERRHRPIFAGGEE